MQWSEALEEENDWIDVKVADIWAEGKKYVSGSIQSGIYIREELAEITAREILNGEVTILLPFDAQLQNISKENNELGIPAYLQEVYGDWLAGGEIYDSEKWNCGFAFAYQEAAVDFERWYESVEERIGDRQEATVFYAKEIKESMTFTVKGYDSQDTQLYSFPFLKKVGSQMLLGIVCCKTDDAVIWKKLSYEMLHSLKCKEGGHNERIGN